MGKEEGRRRKEARKEAGRCSQRLQESTTQMWICCWSLAKERSSIKGFLRSNRLRRLRSEK
eukprot:1845624-Rhodomonas_salina.1